MSLVWLVFSLYFMLVHGMDRELQIVEFPKTDKRPHECKEPEGCEIVCYTNRCKHEIIRPSADALTAATKNSVIEVVCIRSMSCIGIIRMDIGSTDKTKYRAIIDCGVETESCLGGLYQFHSVRLGIFEGNARESVITFKTVKKAVIFVAHRIAQDQFFMNQILTEDVDNFYLKAAGPHSASASVMNLGGVSGEINIECHAVGSCAGAIIILKKCGGVVSITCGEGACNHLLLLMRATDGCTTIRNVYLFFHGWKGRLPTIFALCEGESSPKCISKTAKKNNPKLHEFFKKEELVTAIRADLSDLQTEWEEAQKNEKIANNMKWVLSSDHINHWGGVALEAAFGSITVGALMVPGVAAGAAIGAVATGVTAAAIGASVIAGTIGAAIPLVIAGTIFGAVYGYKKYKKHKFNKKWGINPDVDAQAREQIISFYDQDEFESDEDYYLNSMDYNQDGSIVLYDFFTGEKYDHHNKLKNEQKGEDLGITANAEYNPNTHNRYDKYISNGHYVPSPYLAPNQYQNSYPMLVPLATILFVCVALFCVLCLVVYGITMIGGCYIFGKTKQTKQTQESDQNHSYQVV